MNAINGVRKRNAVSFLLGIALVLFEIWLVKRNSLFWFHPVQGSAILCAFGMVLAVSLFLFTRDFVPCAVLQAVSCLGKLLYFLFCIVLKSGCPIDTILLSVAFEWAGIELLCIVAAIFQKKDSIRCFSAFFKGSSMIFGLLFSVLFLYLSFFKAYIPQNRIRVLNLIPFIRTLAPLLRGIGSSGSAAYTAFSNIAANILLFAPIGFYLRVFRPNPVHKKRNLCRDILIVLLISLLVETAQYLFAVGMADIDDVLMNVLGGILGILFYEGTERLYRFCHDADHSKLFVFRD